MKNGSGDGFARALEKIAAALVLVLLCCFLLALVFAAFTETASLNTNDPSGEHIDFRDDNAFLNSLLALIYLCLLYLFYRRCEFIPLRRMERALLVWVFLIGAAFIASTKLEAPIYSDSYLVTYAA